MSLYTHLSLRERKRLFTFRDMGMSIKKIAEKLNRHRSTIYRELTRNVDGCYYFPHKANELYHKRRNHRKNKIRSNQALYHYIIRRLKQGWSPEQIAGVLKISDKNYSVCHETIYQYIYGQQNKGLYQYLHYKKPKRGKRKGRKAGSGKYHGIKLIHQRPEDANERNIGHWEGDTIHFSKALRKMNVGTFVERKTRFLHLTMNADFKSNTVMGKLEKVIMKEPDKLWKTITVDQGSEFANYRLIERNTKCHVYFCEAHSPWQKGSNENMNGRLRKYLPRDMDVSNLSQELLDFIAEKFNNTPRKCLSYLTPKQALLEECPSYSRTSN